MQNASRNFNDGDVVSVVDTWGGKAIATTARILHVSKRKKKFMAVLSEDTYRRYDFADYGRIIFDTAEEAKNVADKIPVPGTIVYILKRGKIHEERVIDVCSKHNKEGVADIIIKLVEDEEAYITANISIKQIGEVLFSSKEDAEKNKK